jgi:hypothetical protein
MRSEILPVPADELSINCDGCLNSHPETAAKKHLDTKCGGGFEYQGALPDPIRRPYVVSRFQISEHGDVLYPHYYSMQVNASFQTIEDAHKDWRVFSVVRSARPATKSFIQTESRLFSVM